MANTPFFARHGLNVNNHFTSNNTVARFGNATHYILTSNSGVSIITPTGNTLLTLGSINSDASGQDLTLSANNSVKLTIGANGQITVVGALIGNGVLDGFTLDCGTF